MLLRVCSQASLWLGQNKNVRGSVRKLYYSNGSPFARKVRIVLYEKGLAYEPDINDKVRPAEEIQDLNPNLAVPILVDGDLTLFESNLIIDYLLRTYPEAAVPPPQHPPLAPSMTRPDRHWEDAKTLATIETFANSLVNIRLMAADGVMPDTSAYMARQATRVQRCLDWLERRATADGFAPGWLSVMYIALICPIAYGKKEAC